MIKPNFEEWAMSLVIASPKLSTVSGRVAMIEAVTDALQQAYEQGYHYGLNNGWAQEQEKHPQEEWTAL